MTLFLIKHRGKFVAIFTLHFLYIIRFYVKWLIQSYFILTVHSLIRFIYSEKVLLLCLVFKYYVRILKPSYQKYVTSFIEMFKHYFMFTIMSVTHIHKHTCKHTHTHTHTCKHTHTNTNTQRQTHTHTHANTHTHIQTYSDLYYAR